MALAARPEADMAPYEPAPLQAPELTVQLSPEPTLEQAQKRGVFKTTCPKLVEAASAILDEMGAQG